VLYQCFTLCFSLQHVRQRDLFLTCLTSLVDGTYCSSPRSACLTLEFYFVMIYHTGGACWCRCLERCLSHKHAAAVTLRALWVLLFALANHPVVSSRLMVSVPVASISVAAVAIVEVVMCVVSLWCVMFWVCFSCAVGKELGYKGQGG
jgi:hypothetical protein